MAAPISDQLNALSKDLLDAFETLNGSHPGFRPAHSKGAMFSGTFTPAIGVGALTRAPHTQRPSTTVSVRYSDFAGFPTVADNDPQNASPRGCAIRFHLAEHVHTDIVAHSFDGFPTRTAEEFLQFLRAAANSGPEVTKPTSIESFLKSHPKALEFVMGPKPFPTSFASESFFSVTAYKFISADGSSRFGRYRLRPDGGGEYLDATAAAAKGPNYLFEEIAGRIAKGPVKIRIVVQVAGDGDIVDDATEHWPADRPEVEFGTVTLTAAVPDDAAAQKQIIFDPIPRVDGIESSGDPLLEPRAAVYVTAGRKRRKA